MQEPVVGGGGTALAAATFSTVALAALAMAAWAATNASASRVTDALVVTVPVAVSVLLVAELLLHAFSLSLPEA